MRKLAAGLAIALIGWAAYLIANTATHPGPDPVQPATSSDPYVPVCPTPTAVHAVWPQRGAPCPAVTTTMTVGGDST